MQKYQLPVPLPTMGINCLDDSLIADNEAAQGTVNISFKNGMPQTRKGYSKQTMCPDAGATSPITRIYFRRVTNDKRIDYAAGGYLFEIDALGTKTAIGLVDIPKPALIPYTGAMDGVAYGDHALVLTGSKFQFFGVSPIADVPIYSPTQEEVAQWGTNVLTDAPDEINLQRWIVNDDNRYWVAGYKNLVRVGHLSETGAQPGYFPSLQVFKLDEDCTGIARYMGEVMLFTENSATLVEGSTPLSTIEGYYRRKPLPGGYGCSQAESIAIGDNSLYWANRNGVFRYTYMPTGYSIPECVSEFAIKDATGQVRTRSVKRKISEITDWTKVFATFCDHEYRLYIGNGEVLCFDTIMNSWAFYRYANEFACGAVDEGRLYYGGADSFAFGV
jgi:hypothetical protein